MLRTLFRGSKDVHTYVYNINININIYEQLNRSKLVPYESAVLLLQIRKRDTYLCYHWLLKYIIMQYLFIKRCLSF